MKVATIVLHSNGNVLLIKKPTNRYSMPGGKVEHEEIPIRTACREFLEETGLVINNLKLLVISDIVSTNRSYELYTYYSEDFHGETILDSPEGILEWKSIAELSSLEMYPGDLKIIRHCLNSNTLVNMEYSY